MRSTTHWLKRIASWFDAALAGMENHDALVDSAIRELGARLAAAERLLERARADAERTDAELRAQLERAAEGRRRASLEPDELAALAWLRRSRTADHTARSLRGQLEDFASATTALERDVRRMAEQLGNAQRARDLLHARRERSALLDSLTSRDPGRDSALAAALERWETSVRSAERRAGSSLELACVEQELEDDSGLLAELAALRRTET